jgi:hypothetical protein
MNERIRELVSTARQQATSDTKDGKCFDVDLFHKKFAELIVRECCLLTEEYQHRVTFYRADETIKKHFGIEE